MSRIVSGQLRLLDESSKRNAQHSGMGLGMFEGKMPSAQRNPEQDHPNLVRDANMRGKTITGIVKEESKKLVKKSTFVEAWSHFSVGFDLSKEDPKDHNKNLKLMRKGKRKITHPNRKGKSDVSGLSQPNQKEQKPPTKKSDIMAINPKKMSKSKKNKDKGHKKIPKNKIQVKKTSVKLDK